MDQLAAMLGLAAATVSHHLSRLAGVGIVESRAEAPYSTYRLRSRVFDKLARRLLDALPRAAPSAALDAFDRRAPDRFMDTRGRLKSIPAQLKKRQAILRYLATRFEDGQMYTEPEMNQVLADFHPDISTWRRELIIEGLMDREADGAAYWRVSTHPAADGPGA